jgi:hypothetical protein
VSTASAEPQGPLIPLPQLTPTALRRAVAQITPSALPQLDRHLAEAAEQAEQAGDFAPLRAFAQQWGMHVAIERHPHRAARLHELERLVGGGADRDTVRAATAEIGRIVDAALAEIGLAPVRPAE